VSESIESHKCEHEKLRQYMVASDIDDLETSIWLSGIFAVLATLFYLIPSQPHFPGAGDFVQLSILSIRIFKITNRIFKITKCASVFFAIASIMFAMPKPTKDRFERWQWTPGSFDLAVLIFVISIFGMLIAFVVVLVQLGTIFYVVLVYCVLWLRNLIC